MYYTGADGLLSPLVKGAGAILMLHQVLPSEAKGFSPNRILQVTPEFLDQTIRQVIEAGFEILSIDELSEKLRDGDLRRPFVCFTLDDAYRDNLAHAYPVFKRYGIPFTVYAPTDYLDGAGELWWLSLEHALVRLQRLELRMDGALRVFDLSTCERKEDAYNTIYWWLRSVDERTARATVADVCREAGYDATSLCRDLIMTWDELRTLASDPLVTIGAHTRRHMALAKLDAASAREEMASSVMRIEQELGRQCRHFSYPYGCEKSAGTREFDLARELGMATAVTARKGQIDAAHGDCLTGLPRFSLNGDYQDPRYIQVMLSGMPFRLWNALGRVSGANVCI